MQIIELQAENVKRIKAINIKPSENMVVVEGKNAQGKTSALDCISYALGGKKLIPDNPIREGQETAFVKLDLGEYQVTRTWTKKNTYLKIENKDGFKSSNPQEMLDLLIGDLSFDPMSFCNFDKNKRIEVLKTICKLDFDDLKKDYEKTYENRTHFNKQIEILESQLKQYADIEPFKAVRDIKEVEKERYEILDYNNKICLAVAGLQTCKKEVLEIEEKIQKLHKELASKMELIGSYEKTSSLALKDTAPLNLEVQEIIKQSSLINSHKNKESLEANLKEIKSKKEACEFHLSTIKESKEKRLSEARFPVNGMSISSSDIIYKGIEFSQLSSAEKIKISMAMAMSLNPKIKIIRIMNGSLLDAEAMAQIKSIAEERDFQVFMERVSDKKNENTIWIEEGEVK